MRSRIDPDIQNLIRELDLQGWNAAQIHMKLTSDEATSSRAPTLRTVQRKVKQLRPSDPSGSWSFAQSDPEEAALVLPVVAEVIERTEGRRRVTKAEADLVARIRHVAPDMNPWPCFALAVAYLRKSEAGDETESLDAILAFQAWKGDEYLAHHSKAVAEGWVKEAWGYYAAYFLAGSPGHPAGMIMAATDAGISPTITVGEPPKPPTRSRRRSTKAKKGR